VILFVSGEYPPDIGGVGDYTARLRTALADLGCDSTALSRREVKRWDARSLVRVVRTAPRQGVVHIEFQAAAFDLLGDVCLMPAVLRRFRPGVRTATTFHDARVPYLFPKAGRLRPAAVRLLARTSDAVIAADMRDLTALGGPSPRHHQVPIGPNLRCAPPPGYDRAAFRARLGLARADLAVVYFGLLNASKGLDLLLDSFERILARHPRARLLLLGGEAGASDRTDRSTAARLRGRIDVLGDHVVRTGWLEPEQLSAYLLAGDVALLPYRDGASARRGSLLACAEHRLPIVSTQPAGREVAPFLDAQPPDAEALAVAVLRAHRDPGHLQAASRALAEETAWPRIATAHQALYGRLLYSER
jgi:glycosyltransferase involved in cell wall biosynthesis